MAMNNSQTTQPKATAMHIKPWAIKKLKRETVAENKTSKEA
jgi:hypothetical protein